MSCQRSSRRKRQVEHPGNQVEDYERLTEEKRQVLGEWILATFQPAKVAGPRYPRNSIGAALGFRTPTSYGLRHDFEQSERGFYVTNGQFKGAMIAAGFEVTESTRADTNWKFKVKLRR